MKMKSESEVSQSCLTLSDPMDCSLPGSSIHGILQARVLEWGAIAFSGEALYSQQKQDRELTVAQMVKNLPAMWDTRVQSLDWEHPLEEGMAIHFSILAWRIPWTEGLVGCSPRGR